MTQNRKVLLVVPPTGLYIREDRCQTPIEDLKTVALRPPIDLMYAAAAFEQAGCTCRLIDLPAERLGWRDLEAALKDFSPDFLVISATTPSLAEDLKSAEVAKRIAPNIVTIAKGAHFNVCDVETLEHYPALDMVLRGEYELTCREIGEGKDSAAIAGVTCRDKAGKIVRTADRPFIEDLDVLPFPARHLVKNNLYIRPDTMQAQTTIITNRGCPFDCIFCLANQVAGRKNRIRSVANILAEIEHCISTHSIRNFLFRSDLFTMNKQWVIDLCREIVARRLNIEWACNSRVDTIDEEMLDWMRRAHCWLIAYGVETGSQDLLERMNKKATLDDARRAVHLTREAGIKSSIYLLFGLPWDTPETLREDVSFAIELDADFLEIFYIYPFPGTQLYEFAISHGLLKAHTYPTAAYSEPAMPTLSMSVEELSAWRRKAMRMFYLRSRFILRTLKRSGSPKALIQYIRYGFIQLFDLLLKR
jgi:anaerobic magnesium-protoporphyrin IX monomethyl ester cyclase